MTECNSAQDLDGRKRCPQRWAAARLLSPLSYVSFLSVGLLDPVAVRGHLQLAEF